MFAKHAYWKRYQGFESLTLRSKKNSGRSVVRSSRLVWDQEVAGSNPAAPTVLVVFSKLFNGCVAHLDRAFRFYRDGHRFEIYCLKCFSNFLKLQMGAQLSWIEHLPSKQTVPGSNPGALTKEKSFIWFLFFYLCVSVIFFIRHLSTNIILAIPVKICRKE